jgi:predicted ATPase/class 3 adenylate cyclase
MTELPTGTVTFLFTDIQGSTTLLNRLGERYGAILQDHDVFLRREISKHRGVEVSTAGDSFFVVFTSAVRAVSAAVGIQRALAEHQWPTDCTVRVRIGIHSGEGTLTRNDYVGIDVNRASRITSAGHGGQIILSEATRALIEGALPEELALRDLGQHRLKDLPRAEHLYDVVIEGLESDFPPPRTLDARPNNLPHQLTSFIGRDQELKDVMGLLEQSRLLTLTGPGGTGKTRLALRLADELLPRMADGVFFADLSAVTDATLVGAVIAKALGVPEVSGRPILEDLREYLGDKELLLVVDNFEQVATAAPVLEELLSAARHLKIVVTSRFVLSIRGEHEYAVPPLPPPDVGLEDRSRLERLASVRLFVERAQAVQPNFRLNDDNARHVGEIVARLDGLPLAIELAATRSKILTPAEMMPRLKQRLSLLTSTTRSLPERQRTLRDAIAWSHDLLDPSDQRLFARLSVFSGGWTLEAAEAICRPDEGGVDVLEGLTSLVDKSLVRMSSSSNGPSRFSLLQTIWEFAEEKLREGPDHEPTHTRHARYFLDLALAAEPHLTAEDQAEWLDRCDEEHGNIRAALRWAITSGDARSAQASAGALWRFWHQRGHLTEGRRWLEEVLAMPRGQEATASRAKALIGAGGIAWWQQDAESARALYEEAVAIERRRADPQGLAEALYNQSFVVAGYDIAAATRLLEESGALFREAGDRRGVAQVSSMLVIPDAQAGDWEAVVERLEETTRLWREVRDQLHLAFNLVWLASAYGRMGRRKEAWETGIEALDLFRAVDNPTGIGLVFSDFAWLALWEGSEEDAVRLAGVAESIRDKSGGSPGGFAGLLEGDPAEQARTRLPPRIADQAWAEGLGMDTEDALSYVRSIADAGTDTT